MNEHRLPRRRVTVVIVLATCIGLVVNEHASSAWMSPIAMGALSLALLVLPSRFRRKRRSPFRN